MGTGTSFQPARRASQLRCHLIVQQTPPMVSTLVEPFQRGSERVRTHHDGVGLGLAIVNSIIHAHDGTLTLAARPGGGLCVTVRLPELVTSKHS
ncbi:hypothetical protein B7435_14275 [Mycolicibacterium peregrinum]|nr:hypothetical protein B7435_14275 [Mycolicibacterium peregrinum]